MYNSIGIILPSRGMIFAEVIESLENQRPPHIIYRYHISHDLPIPECLNKLVDEALPWQYDYLLFLEEDTVPPPGSIEAMMELLRKDDAPSSSCIEYPLYNGASSIWRDKKGEIAFCGFGCTLVNTKVFNTLQKPYFRDDMELMIGEGMNGDETRWQKARKPGYGKHDVYFFKKLTEAGFKIHQVPGMQAKHLKLVDTGKELTNKGLHTIGLKADKITRRYTL